MNTPDNTTQSDELDKILAFGYTDPAFINDIHALIGGADKIEDARTALLAWRDAAIKQAVAEAQVHLATKVLMSKTEGLFDGPDLFIKRAPIEQAFIDVLGYETVRAIKDSATAATLSNPVLENPHANHK